MSSERPDAPAAPAEKQLMSNPGETLREARAERKMSQLDIAQNLKISVAAVDGIENGLYDRLPGDTFARGYIRSYARMVGLDPNRLALEFDRYRGIEVRERSVNGISRIAEPRRSGGGLMRWVSLLILLILIASVAWWYDSRGSDVPSVPADPLAGDQLMDEVEVDSLTLPAAIAEQAEALTGGNLGLDEVEQAQSQSAVTDVSGDEDAASASGVDTAVVADSAAAVASQDSPAIAAAVPQPSASAALSMSFVANCWVQVKAVSGEVLHSGLMQAGQTLNLSHPGAVDLVIGDRSAVQSINYRGEQITLPQQSQSGVARLRLGQ